MSFKPLKALDCPACGSDQSADHKVYNGHRLKRCNRCGLVFTAERSFPTTQYEDVYSGVAAYQMMIDDARLTHEGKKGYNDLWWFKRKALKWLHTRVPSGRLLDLGSGPGTLLMIAREKYGYEVQGVEPASAAAEVAKRYGVPTYCGTVEEFAGRHPEKFDAITAFEVLEHVADPLSFLTAAKKLLNKKGILLLSMPNLDDPYCLRQPNAAAMPPIHINFFSRKSLCFLLKRAGYSMEHAYTHPIPGSSIQNIYGRTGFLLRVPYLVATKLIGRQDGTTLLALAKPSEG